jgi:hypothetical protein
MLDFVSNKGKGMAVKSLKEVSKEVTEQLSTRATLLETFSLLFKVVGVASAFTIGIAKIRELEDWVTYAATGLALVSGLFVLFADRKSSKTLSQARTAIDQALEKENELADDKRKYEAAEGAYITEIERLSQLQAARDLFRAILETVAASQSTPDEQFVISQMLQLAKRQLFIAHGFKITDFYTICVYQREIAADGKAQLRCKAHIRAIDCELAEARVWKEGIGVAGAALAQGIEVVVPDLTDQALGTLYQLPQHKDDDDVRYRAIVAEPICLDDDGNMWGILIATSSEAGHFSVEDRSYVNVTESLAGMISLAIKLVRAKKSGDGSSSQPSSAENQ